MSTHLRALHSLALHPQDVVDDIERAAELQRGSSTLRIVHRMTGYKQVGGKAEGEAQAASRLRAVFPCMFGRGA